MYNVICSTLFLNKNNSYKEHRKKSYIHSQSPPENVEIIISVQKMSFIFDIVNCMIHYGANLEI